MQIPYTNRMIQRIRDEKTEPSELYHRISVPTEIFPIAGVLTASGAARRLPVRTQDRQSDGPGQYPDQSASSSNRPLGRCTSRVHAQEQFHVTLSCHKAELGFGGCCRDALMESALDYILA